MHAESAPADDEARIGRVYGSRDFARGVAAFLDKEQAVFTGR
jgi:hypothetical protein